MQNSQHPSVPGSKNRENEEEEIIKDIIEECFYSLK